jgi:hypothetical protein
MKKDINDWTLAECFLFGALVASGRYFWAGEGHTGKQFQFYQSLDGSTASVVTDVKDVRPVQDNDMSQD